jgi:hypothetical protein
MVVVAENAERMWRAERVGDGFLWKIYANQHPLTNYQKWLAIMVKQRRIGRNKKR